MYPFSRKTSHALLKYARPVLILTKKSLNKKFYQKIEAENSTVRIYEYGISLKLENPSELGVSNHNTLFLDADKVQFPLVLRTWKEGDYFYPSGMSGKKKMSKFFKDLKLSILEKENPFLYDDIKHDRLINGEKYADDNTPERLHVKYKVKQAQANLLSRTYEEL